MLCRRTLYKNNENKRARIIILWTKLLKSLMVDPLERSGRKLVHCHPGVLGIMPASKFLSIWQVQKNDIFRVELWNFEKRLCSCSSLSLHRQWHLHLHLHLHRQSYRLPSHSKHLKTFKNLCVKNFRLMAWKREPCPVFKSTFHRRQYRHRHHC